MKNLLPVLKGGHLNRTVEQIKLSLYKKILLLTQILIKSLSGVVFFSGLGFFFKESEF